ncbi:MAG: elongation factor-1 alpha [Alphaproteobacteria bacterium]|nr:elongation factor-1 alpha [Alphaproteobacteria bacterium]
MFFHYSEFPLSMRTLFTGTLIVLGIGYLFAMIQIYSAHAGRDGKPGLSVEDIRIAYSGQKDATKLEGALMGPMSGMLPLGERGDIVGWVRRGLDEIEYESRIRSIFDKRCVACHDGSNPHIPDLNGYEGVAEEAQIDTGMDLFTLVRVSHIHLFGLTFIFFIMGLIFSHAFFRPVWVKSVVVAAPFLAIVLDIASWYLTKLNPALAWVVIISGALMGTSFAFQWIVSMYQIWFYKYSAGDRAVDATTI